eukprot:scaffold13895_cov20-Tisochrysis_lutea.AAC.1
MYDSDHPTTKFRLRGESGNSMLHNHRSMDCSIQKQPCICVYLPGPAWTGVAQNTVSNMSAT